MDDGRTTLERRLRDGGRDVVRRATTATARWRPDPDMVVIGVKRGGTTSLFRDLERHPAMCPLVPSATVLPLRENTKGVHYFDSDLTRSLQWYRGHFPTELTLARRRRRVGASFTAEASPYYFFHPLAPERAARALPTTTFVVMLRDPVERTVSHWAEQTRNGVERLPLRDAIDAEPDRVGDAAELLRRGVIAESNAHEQQTYVAQSRYGDSLQRWFDAVGRERVVVLYSEDYYRDPERALDTILASIGIGPIPPTVDVTHRNAAPRPGRIDPDLEAELTARHRPDVERVAALLGAVPPWPRFAA